MLIGIKHAPKSMYRPTAVMLNGRGADEVGTAGLSSRIRIHLKISLSILTSKLSDAIAFSSSPEKSCQLNRSMQRHLL
jgi:hypothetical protein